MHIIDWPIVLNLPYQPSPMFPTEYGEWEFWQHLFDCQECRDEAQSRIEDSVLKEEAFWGEVEEYLKGVHLSWRNLAQGIIRQARSELVPGTLSNEVRQELLESERPVRLHLSICSRCCKRSEEMEDRLHQIHPDVRQAYQNWIDSVRKSRSLR